MNDDQKQPKEDRRTVEYLQQAAMEGRLDISPDIQLFSELIYEAGYRSTRDHSYWVPSKEIAGVVLSMFPQATPLAAVNLSRAIRLAEPEARRVRRRAGKGPAVWGFSGITGPGGHRCKVVGG